MNAHRMHCLSLFSMRSLWHLVCTTPQQGRLQRAAYCSQPWPIVYYRKLVSRNHCFKHRELNTGRRAFCPCSSATTTCDGVSLIALTTAKPAFSAAILYSSTPSNTLWIYIVMDLRVYELGNSTRDIISVLRHVLLHRRPLRVTSKSLVRAFGSPDSFAAQAHHVFVELLHSDGAVAISIERRHDLTDKPPIEL